MVPLPVVICHLSSVFSRPNSRISQIAGNTLLLSPISTYLPEVAPLGSPSLSLNKFPHLSHRGPHVSNRGIRICLCNPGCQHHTAALLSSPILNPQYVALAISCSDIYDLSRPPKSHPLALLQFTLTNVILRSTGVAWCRTREFEFLSYATKSCHPRQCTSLHIGFARCTNLL